MRYVDIHAHVQFAAYDADRDAVMTRAREAGAGMINVGTQQDTSQAAVDLAHQYPDIAWAAIGLHPIHTSKSFHDKNELGEGNKEFISRGEEVDYDFYKKLGADPRVVAIGECGLDYYHLTDETKTAQKKAFEKQIELAIDLQKPLMIHCRDAYDDLYDMLYSFSKQGVHGVIHFFIGDGNTAEKFLNLGFLLSFTGVITFKKNRYEDIVKNTPLDMILADTDSPYVSPEPLRGKRNEPVNVRYIYEKIAEIKCLSVEQAQETLLKNAKRVFGI